VRSDQLILKLDKKHLGLRGPEPIKRVIEDLKERAEEAGCGQVARDEVVCALLLAALHASDESLRGAVESFRSTRESALDPPRVHG
jgi:hypothetical protein